MLPLNFPLSIILLVGWAEGVPVTRRQTANFVSHANVAMSALDSQMYNQSTGLWQNQWWESACSLQSHAWMAQIDSSYVATAEQIFDNTFNAAPGLGGGEGWLDGYYDDEGWWALAWIKAYDVTQNPSYLQTAQIIFNDMTTGWGANCGGQWWDKAHTYNAAIANELFMDVAAHLANRVPSAKNTYIAWALNEWNWFSNSGLINPQFNINDGINNDTCQNNGAPVYSYNQGVILDALVELNIAAPNDTYLPLANKIAQAAISKLSNSNGVLVDVGDSPDDGATGSQFKGIFLRSLAILQAATPNPTYVTFIQNNANYVLANDRSPDGLYGPMWPGPYSTSNVGSQNSGVDLMLAAAAVS